MIPKAPPKGTRVTRAVDASGRRVFVFSFPPPVPGHPELSVAERAVVELLMAGRSRKDVAREREVALTTVHKQVETAYRKLGVRSRTELARLLLGTSSHGDESVPAAGEPGDGSD